MKATPVTPRGFTNVYEPAEDTFFLSDCLEKDENWIQKFRSPVVVELGTGSGAVTSFIPQLIDPKYIPMATDVNPSACKCAAESWKKNFGDSAWPLEVIRGSLLSFMRPNTIDILIFNPPYVPSEVVPPVLPIDAEEDDDKWLDAALDGGENGMEVTRLILNDLERSLSQSGCAYILFLDANHPVQVSQQMESSGWSSHLVDTVKAGCEVLSVYRFSRA